MRIDYEGKSVMMDNISYTWFIESDINSYRLSLEFIGAIDEEGNEEPELSCYADIDLTEINHHDKALMDEIENMLKNEIEIERKSDVVMICAPKTLEYLTTRDEDSYPTTMAKFQLLMAAVTNVLALHEMKGEMLP